jgi:ribosome production factor 1
VLQEIGPRFTLKLRWLKKGIPAVQNLGAPAVPLKLATDEDHGDPSNNTATDTAPPDRDEYEWQWTVSD